MKAQEYLSKNTNVKEVFESSDKFLFLNEQDAKNHAKTLKNTKVKTYTSKGDSDVIVDFGLDSLKLIPENYNKMKTLAKSIGLEVEGNKADDYIKALEAYKETKSE